MLFFLSDCFLVFFLPIQLMCFHSYCSRFEATVLLPSPKIKLVVFWLDASWSSRQDFCLVRQELVWAFLLYIYFLKTNGKLAFLGRERDRNTSPLQIGMHSYAFEELILVFLLVLHL